MLGSEVDPILQISQHRSCVHISGPKVREHHVLTALEQVLPNQPSFNKRHNFRPLSAKTQASWNLLSTFLVNLEDMDQDRSIPTV